MKLLIFSTLLFFSIFSFGQKETKSVGFIENKGQIVDQKGKANASVLYLLNSQGLNVQLRKGGFSYDVYEVTKPKSSAKENLQPDRVNFLKEDFFKDKTEMSFHRIDVDFLNCNKNASLKAEGKSSDYDNYYTAAHAPEGILYVHKFQKVTYENIYDKIDVVFFLPEDRSKAVEYNFIIHPGGKISDIQMKFKGAKTVLSEEKIKIQARFGVMEETLPLSWTEVQGNREVVSVKYKEIRKDVYGFSSENFGGKTLIIDPVPIRLWGTYYGAGSNFELIGLETDALSNVYFSGVTNDTGAIATLGAFKNSITGFSDGFLAKFNSEGQRIWGTYYGGNNSDSFTAIGYFNNELILAGITNSPTNISTPGSFKENHTMGGFSNSDGFIVKFNLNGERIWGTYFGGENSDNIYKLAIDPHGNFAVAGSTYSINGIGTPGTFKENKQQPVNPNTQGEGFIAKFDNSGNQIWGSYYFLCAIWGLDIDSNSNIYFSGNGYNFTNFATPGTHQPTFLYNTDSGVYNYESFIIKFDPNGQRIWGTFYGYGNENNHCLKIDHNDDVYISGYTKSKLKISTPNSHQPNLNETAHNSDAYLAKFSPTGQQLWGTYYGGDDQENLSSVMIDIDEDNNVFLAGNTFSTNGISTPDSYNPVSNGWYDSYIVKFTPTGSRLWGTYFGGNSGDFTNYIKYDKSGIFYIAGYTFSPNLATSNGHQQYLNSSSCYFIEKFRDCLSTTTASSNSPICLNGDIRLTASGGTNYLWNGPNGFTSTLQNPVILNASLLNSGAYTCSITGSAGCDNVINVNVSVGDIIAPVPDIATLPTITGNCNSITIPTPTATDNCSGVLNGTTTSPLTYSSVGNYTIVWNYRDANNNISTQNQTVVISPEPLPIVSQTPFLCQNVSHLLNDHVKLSDISITGQNIKWYDALTGGNILPLTTRLENGVTYYASQTISGCESARIAVSPTIQETTSPIGFAVQYFCDTESLTVQNLVVTGTDVVFYNDRYAGTALPFSTPLVDGVIYWASQTINGCKSYVRLPVFVDIINEIPANDYQTLICDELNNGQERVALSSYNPNLIANTNLYSFEYYNSFQGANTDNASDKINDFDSFRLIPGDNTVYVKIGMNSICFKIVELKLTVISSPVLAMKDVFSLCENNDVTVHADPGYRYLWSNGATTPSIKINQPGNYWVTVFKDHGSVVCSTTKNFQVVISKKATINSITVKDWTANENMISVYVTGNGDYEYSLDGVNYQTSNQFLGLTSGEYRVYVNDKNGCGFAWEDLFLLMYPKFFTPNGDGSNDHWKIKFSTFESDLSVKIFDRYGKFIKELSHNDTGWDGTYNGEPLPSTDYWFVITRANGQEHRGHFSLKR